MIRNTIFLGTILVVAGCATIVASGPDRVPISSYPSGAIVTVDGVPLGRTPTTVDLSRSGNGLIHIELEGYEPIQLQKEKVFNGWFIGNLAFGGIIGIIVDVAASNVTKFSDGPVMVNLRAVNQRGQEGQPISMMLMPLP